MGLTFYWCLGLIDFYHSVCKSVCLAVLLKHHFKCVFPQVWCALVTSEPSCDQTEFFHPNGTCVACPVCGPGEQLSEVTHTALNNDNTTVCPLATWLQVCIIHQTQDCGFGDGGESVCILCEDGKFSADTGVAPCMRCTQCHLLNRLEKTACSPSSDAQCGRCLPG